MKEDPLAPVFRALADDTRRRMLDVLLRRPGLTVGELTGRFGMSRIGAMKHLRVLEEANLVVSRREGRTRRLYLNAVPIRRIHDRWTSRFTSAVAGALSGMKDELER